MNMIAMNPKMPQTAQMSNWIVSRSNAILEDVTTFGLVNRWRLEVEGGRAHPLVDDGANQSSTQLLARLASLGDDAQPSAAWCAAEEEDPKRDDFRCIQERECFLTRVRARSAHR